MIRDKSEENCFCKKFFFSFFFLHYKHFMVLYFAMVAFGLLTEGKGLGLDKYIKYSAVNQFKK